MCVCVISAASSGVRVSGGSLGGAFGVHECQSQSRRCPFGGPRSHTRQGNKPDSPSQWPSASGSAAFSTDVCECMPHVRASVYVGVAVNVSVLRGYAATTTSILLFMCVSCGWSGSVFFRRCLDARTHTRCVCDLFAYREEGGKVHIFVCAPLCDRMFICAPDYVNI